MASVLVEDDGRCGLLFVGLVLLLEVDGGGAVGDIIVAVDIMIMSIYECIFFDRIESVRLKTSLCFLISSME